MFSLHFNSALVIIENLSFEDLPFLTQFLI